MATLSFQTILTNIQKSRLQNEANLRKQLAYLYRIFDYYGWCDLIVTHLSVRIPGENALLIIPFGLAFNEITPDNLVKVDFNGQIITSNYGFNINLNGTTVHRAVYSNKPEVNCILHTHSHYGVAVSNLQSELLNLDQIAMMFHKKVGYHSFDTLFINDNDQRQLLLDIENKQALILKNHGLLTIGKTIEEAFWFHYYLETSCKIQILTLAPGLAINFPSQEALETTAAKYALWKDKNSHIEASDSELLFDAAKRKIGYMFD